MWFLLFIKQLPVIAIAEIKEIVPPKLRQPHDPAREHRPRTALSIPSRHAGEYD